jgi:hypothetical protein
MSQYDAIVAGARCAGSTTAMLLARRGYRVLLVDKAVFPSDTMSTHILHPPGVAANCHCTMCRRIHAAPYVTWLVVPAGRFRYTGELPARLVSSPGGSRDYCPSCATHVTCVNTSHPTESTLRQAVWIHRKRSRRWSMYSPIRAFRGPSACGDGNFQPLPASIRAKKQPVDSGGVLIYGLSASE